LLKFVAKYAAVSLPKQTFFWFVLLKEFLHIKERGCKDVDWIPLARDSDKFRPLLNKFINIWIL
jgi:hypothetical protein